MKGAVESYRMRRDERSEVGIRRLTVLAGNIGPLTLLAGWCGAHFESIPGANSQGGSPSLSECIWRSPPLRCGS